MPGVVFARRRGARRAVDAGRAAEDEEIEPSRARARLEQGDRRIDVQSLVVLVGDCRREQPSGEVEDGADAGGGALARLP